MNTAVKSSKSRISWVDYAKGICIILVVGMHSTSGVEKAAEAWSYLHGFIDWAKPFRMPDFFMISGLFLASRINYPWRTYLDKKIVHFAYFYLLWMTLQYMFRGPFEYHTASGLIGGWFLGLIEPYTTLWFIYMLIVFFLVTKALVKVPAAIMLGIAALLEVMTKLHWIDTGYMMIDEFAARFVYFYAGYWMAKDVFALADRVERAPIFLSFAGLAAWAMFNLVMVQTGLAAQPGLSLVMGFIGAGAVVSMGVLLSKFKFGEALRYCGENSIVIYLAFFLFMAPMRIVLLRYAPWLGLTAISVITTTVAVIGPLVLWWSTRKTPLNFLFHRPHWAQLQEPQALVAQAHAQWHSAAYVSRALHQPEKR